MPEEKYRLNQVSVRLKLSEEPPLYSTEEINSPRRAIEVMKDMMRQLDREYVAIINIDNAGKPINFNVVSIGNINSCQLTMRELLKSAILANSAKILMMHNHPGYRTEKPKPSREDDITTLRVMLAGEFMGIPLMDHIIVAGGTGSCYSYKTEYGNRFNTMDFQKCFGDGGIEGMIKEACTEYDTDRTETDIVAEFRAETDKHFQQICGMTAGEIEDLVKAEAQGIFEDYDMDVEVVDAVISGSRSRGLKNDGSDLDVVLEYAGKENEDAVFGVLNEEKLVIGGVRVDINPIREEQTGTLEQYLPQVENYLNEKAQEYKPLIKVEEIEEENYNQLDNYLSNTKPKSRERQEEARKNPDKSGQLSPDDRPSVRENMKMRKAALEAKSRDTFIENQKKKLERSV